VIVVLDFGSQYTHLITRRIRALGVYAEILPFNSPVEKIKSFSPHGIILSGGPESVYQKDAPYPDSGIFSAGIPILGICYGAQLIAHVFGGKVEKAKIGEYGRAKLKVLVKDKLFQNLPSEFFVWMSHGDVISDVPDSFEILGETYFSPISAFKFGNIFGVQFHPEVYHTEFGLEILKNFVFEICKSPSDWSLSNFVEEKIYEIKQIKGGILCAVSGGVDSTIMAYLLHKAKGDGADFVLVDTGLLRKNEAEKIKKNFSRLGININILDASRIFLSNLKGIKDPERKRKIIGKTFIDVFKDYAISKREEKNIRFLAQGTLYPDVIESGVSASGKAHVIKTHHNVGGLPEELGFELVEPFRQLYKDEVREIGKILGIPDDIIFRHPFPGPGLAVRILGEITKKKIDILREADEILEEELIKYELYNKVWQAFCVLTNSKSTGVSGDRRRYGYVIAVRIVDSVDGMTADWSRVPYEFLDEVSRKITAKIPQVSRVVYDITSKPPATIEWE
jgi:GMP synthase (glutamine-hydrolysing)